MSERERLTDLVHREARLLDENRLDDWLALYAQDATYWIPMDETADPRRQSSIIWDDHSRLTLRVEQLMREARVAQNPASQVLRMISNLEIDTQADAGPTARYIMLAMESRLGDWRQPGIGETRMYPARCELVASPDGSQVRHKRIVLLNRFKPLDGFSFLL